MPAFVAGQGGVVHAGVSAVLVATASGMAQALVGFALAVVIGGVLLGLRRVDQEGQVVDRRTVLTAATFAFFAALLAAEAR